MSDFDTEKAQRNRRRVQSPHAPRAHTGILTFGKAERGCVNDKTKENNNEK